MGSLTILLKQQQSVLFVCFDSPCGVTMQVCGHPLWFDVSNTAVTQWNGRRVVKDMGSPKEGGETWRRIGL